MDDIDAVQKPGYRPEQIPAFQKLLDEQETIVDITMKDLGMFALGMFASLMNGRLRFV